jgi:hypothetical protein
LDLVEALSEVDSVFEEGLEAATHLHPAAAVAVGAVEALLGLAPAGFGDADESVVGAEGLEGHLDGGLVVEDWWQLVVEFRWGLVGVPLEDDLLVGDDFFDGDGDVAGVVGEAPDDGGAFVERGGGSAGGEVGAEFGGVVDGVEDLGQRGVWILVWTWNLSCMGRFPLIVEWRYLYVMFL